MTPTEADLNRQAALAMGWREAPYTMKRLSGRDFFMVSPKGHLVTSWGVAWNPCQDRNQTALLLERVNAEEESVQRFGQILADLASQISLSRSLNALLQPPSLLVIACLKALGYWPEEWEA